MNQECKAYCLAQGFNFSALKEDLINKERAVAYRGLLQVQKWQGDAFIFDFGVLVLWGMDHDQSKKILDAIKAYTIEAYTIEAFNAPIEDSFTFEVNHHKTAVRDDHITLESDDVLEKLAVSYGVAQSVKLAEFETNVDEAIQRTKDIPERIATTGSSQLSRLQTSKMRGRLFLVSSAITQNVNLLDTPEFFWEYPELDASYRTIARYLEVSNRLSIMEKRLQSIHELFNMLADEQKHRHSATLEWIIIGLIAFEIMGFVLHDLLGLI